MARKPILTVEHLTKNFFQGGQLLRVLEDLSFTVARGEFVALLGPSGCGKSTLLNLLAGFDLSYQGKISFNQKPILGPEQERAFVFQQDALFPWLTVGQNIVYGLKNQDPNASVRREKVAAILEDIKLREFEDYYPRQLSGGMKQRVAIARVLVLEPEMLLLDEPFAALDAFTRREMQDLVQNLREKYAPAAILVTHDIDEALLLADRVILLDQLPGKIKDEFVLPFPVKRDWQFSLTSEFLAYKEKIMYAGERDY